MTPSSGRSFQGLVGVCPSIRVLEPVQEWPDARRKEGLRAERTGSYVSTQDRLTTPQMTIHGQAPRVDHEADSTRRNRIVFSMSLSTNSVGRTSGVRGNGMRIFSRPSGADSATSP